MCEPFLGTGTFISRLLSSGIIEPDQLEHKYKHEVFGNEIVLLSYYIASINIESTYRQTRLDQGYADEYTEFKGIALTDTFQLNEADDDIDGLGFDFAENIERLRRQKRARIKVIVMNPPYSAGQKSANDNNQNLKYPRLDGRIEETYVSKSTGTLRNSLYDSYFRALRWGTDRIGDEGVIAFVSNNSFLEGNTADGVRLTLQDEFSDIYIYNLKGNARTQGDRRQQEGGGVFDSGSRTGITIAVFVKTKGHEGQARLHYTEVADYLTRQEKLDQIAANHSIATTTFEPVEPNSHGDWISQRDETFATFQPIGDKATKGREQTPGVFRLYSGGLKTSRDAWVYDFSQHAVSEHVDVHIAYLNEQMQSVQASLKANPQADPGQLIKFDSQRGSVDRRNKSDITRGRPTLRGGDIRISIYRPFFRQSCYFDPGRQLNNDTYQLPQLFPTPQHPNLALGGIGVGALKGFSVLATDTLPDLEMVSKAQWMPLYTWESLPDSEPEELTLFDNAAHQHSTVGGDNAAKGIENLTFDFSEAIGEQVPTFIDGYQRRDNITDATLASYRARYRDELSAEGEQISKEDIFFYVYALLHHPDYRERYEADLKKMLPRIPMVPGFWEFSNIGRELADLHINYETVEPYPITESWSLSTPTDEWEKYRVEKLAWGKTGREKDTSKLVYNDYLTFSDIPSGINEYQVGGRSPLEWMIDRYKITVDKKSQIINDPNDYFHEVVNPRYLADLIKSLITVTVRTQELIAALPALIIEDAAR